MIIFFKQNLKFGNTVLHNFHYNHDIIVMMMSMLFMIFHIDEQSDVDS